MTALELMFDRPLMAGSTSLASCHKAAIARKGAFSADCLQASRRTHTPGHDRSLKKSLHSRHSRLRLPLRITPQCHPVRIIITYADRRPTGTSKNQTVTVNWRVLRLSIYGPVGSLNNCYVSRSMFAGHSKN